MFRRGALLLALTAGCAAFGASRKPAASSSTVSDADFGRLAASQTRPADDARAQLALARDELGRAKLSVVNDQHEGEFARSDQASASADVSRAATQSKIGKDSNDPDQMQEARDDTRAAQQGKEVADARLEYSKKLATSQAAQVTAAERKVDVMTEKVNLAKLQSLEDASIPVAGKYDRATATQRVVDAQTRLRLRDCDRSHGHERVGRGQGALAEARRAEAELNEERAGGFLPPHRGCQDCPPSPGVAGRPASSPCGAHAYAQRRAPRKTDPPVESVLDGAGEAERTAGHRRALLDPGTD